MIDHKELSEMFSNLPERWKQDIKPEEAALARTLDEIKTSTDVRLDCLLGTLSEQGCRMFCFIKKNAERFTFSSAVDDWTPSFKYHDRKVHWAAGKRWLDEIRLPQGSIIKVFCGKIGLGQPWDAEYFMADNEVHQVTIKSPESENLALTGRLQRIDELVAANIGLLPLKKKYTDYKLRIEIT